MHSLDSRFGEDPPRSAAPGAQEGPSLGSGIGFSAPFIQRPVATSLLSAAVILVGVAAYLELPAAALPQVEFFVISLVVSISSSTWWSLFRARCAFDPYPQCLDPFSPFGAFVVMHALD